jgi:hypothetical protein
MIVVYPNNDITVDGEPVTWTDEQWAQYGIARTRPSANPDRAAHRMIDGRPALVFPTVISDGRTQPVKPSADPIYGKRPYQMRDGVLYLQCSERVGCGQWHPSERFTPKSYEKNRWLSTCRPCTNRLARFNNEKRGMLRSQARADRMARLQEAVQTQQAAA